MLVSIHRRAWLRSSLIDLLEPAFEVRTAEVALPLPSRTTGRVMSKGELILTDLVFFLRLLTSSYVKSRDCRLVCFGGHYGALLYGRLAQLFGRERKIYLLNFYLHELGSNPLVRAILNLLLTDRVSVVAQTGADAEFFRQFLPEDRVKHVPYCRDHSEFVDFSEARTGSYVFAGGWTNRDYDAVFRCARTLPEIPFVVAASASNTISEPKPENVTLELDIPPARFDRLVAMSRVVVVPLRHDVGSSGQMVMLSGMQFAKPVIVPDIGGLPEYVEDGSTGVVYRHGDDGALCSAVARVYRDQRAAEALGSAARETYLARFTPKSFDGPVAVYLSA
jgi:glycosyltransferase involved in cell wall biosynthesis